MAEKLDPRKQANFEELLMINVVQLDAVTELLIDKGVFTDEELLAKLKQVSSQYKTKRENRKAKR